MYSEYEIKGRKGIYGEYEVKEGKGIFIARRK